MDKQKQIEEMAKELHCATNESFISCRKIARILVERRGYGNLKEFVERLKILATDKYELIIPEVVNDLADELLKEYNID